MMIENRGVYKRSYIPGSSVVPRRRIWCGYHDLQQAPPLIVVETKLLSWLSAVEFLRPYTAPLWAHWALSVHPPSTLRHGGPVNRYLGKDDAVKRRWKSGVHGRGSHASTFECRRQACTVPSLFPTFHNRWCFNMDVDATVLQRCPGSLAGQG